MAKVLKAVNNHLIVLPLAKDQKTAGGLYVPETAINEPQVTAQVLSVGKDSTDEIKVGDVIFCHERAGMDIMTEGVIYKVVKSDEVYCVVSDEEQAVTMGVSKNE